MTTLRGPDGLERPTRQVDWLGDDRYRVSEPSAGGPDAAPVVDEATVNRMLAAYGLRMARGQLVSTDGFSLAGAGLAAATSFGAAPPLPDVSGPVASLASMRPRLGALGADVSDAALAWVALSTLATTAMREAEQAKELELAQQEAKIDGKQAEIAATRARIDAEKDAALTAFVTSVVVAVAAAAGSALGAAAGASLVSAVASAAGPALGAFSAYASKTGGPQSRADRKEVEEKIWQMQQELAQQSIDEARGGYDQAKELFALALRILEEHAERQSQVVESIARTS